jgi:hypothetical protein
LGESAQPNVLKYAIYKLEPKSKIVWDIDTACNGLCEFDPSLNLNKNPRCLFYCILSRQKVLFNKNIYQDNATQKEMETILRQRKTA